MANETRSINLLPGSHDEGIVAQFLDWALTIGRLLIILTESLALGTFLYRFSLDMRIIDLHDEIKASSFIVANFKSSEDKFRDIQARLALAKQYGEESNKTATMFSDIAEMGRGRITFQNLLITTEIIKIDLQAPSTTTISAFVDALKQYPGITSVSIDKVENKTASAVINVGITAYLQETKQPNQEANPIQSGQATQPEGDLVQ
jgi:hypothetical protein